MHFIETQPMPPPSFRVFADDLSGAAECAAAVACAARRPAPLVLNGVLPTRGNWSADTDSRTMTARAAADVAARWFRDAAAGGPAVLFKKIDSTLRGNVAEELRAILGLRGLVDAVVVCPTLPSQGRTLKDGVLHIHGRPQVDGELRPLNLLRLLATADTEPLLLRPAPGSTAGQLAGELLASVRGGARILVVDAADEGDLRRLARALLAARDGARLLAAGAAGLARALADELLASPQPCDIPALPVPREGPLVAVVGSFNAVTGQQVDALACQPDVHLVRLDASIWLTRTDLVNWELEKAAQQSGLGKSIVLTATGAMPVQSTRDLVQCMAAAAEPLIRRAAILVLTGGDTARTVLDRLGIDRLQVLGELEPGICLSHDGADAPAVVTKAGGFGDSQALLRVLRHFRVPSHTNTGPERKE